MLKSVRFRPSQSDQGVAMTRALFVLQVIATWTYAVMQTLQIFRHETKGLTLALWLMFVSYLVFSLTLAIASYRKHPSTERRWTISIFIQFLAIFSWLFIIGLKTIRWTSGDTLVIALVLVLCLTTVYKYRGVTDHIARGLIAMWCKGLPQLWMAYVICDAHSSQGLPPIALLASHVTSFPRFIQVYLSGKKGGWDRPTKGLFIGEVANVSTWMVVTVMWFLMR